MREQRAWSASGLGLGFGSGLGFGLDVSSSAPSVATCHPNQTSRFLRTKLAHLSSMSSFNMGSESSVKCFRSTTSRMAG